MNAERWQRVQEILELLNEAEPSKREGILERECGDDATLRAEVLRFDALQGDVGAAFLEQPVVATGSSQGNEDLVKGAVVGERWRVIEPIGRGGMGSVYRAERTGDYEQLAAIKVVHRGMDTRQVVGRFENERQILATLEHRSIARVLDGGTLADGRPFFVMELVAGQAIDRWCDDQRLGVRDRLERFLEVCEAVRFAHSKLVVHRDLKPANILIDASGRPKLLDFGIAKLLAPGDVAGADLTSLGVSPMTLRYASPEQVRGEPATVLFDVYALGVLLYRLLTGGFPHDGETDAEITDRIRDDEPTRPSQRLRSAPTEEQETVAAGRGMTREALGRRLDGDLDAILVKALARRPEDRYSSVDRFADDVRRHLDERPIEARPPSLAYRTGRFVQRNTALTALIAVTFGALVGTTGLVLSRAAVQREALAAATIGDRLRELLSDVLSDADPTRTDGADLTASEILDRVVEQAAETESLEERDWLYREIAKIYLQREEGEEALVLQERAAALDLDRSPVDRAWLTSNLCRSLQLLGRNQEAEGLCREAIEVLDGHPTIEPAEVAPVLNNLALALYGRRSQEQAAEAEAIFRRSLAMKRAGGEPEWGDSIVVTRMNLARVMAYQRKLSEAQETFDELLAISEVEEFRRGQILANAGANLVRLTQFDAAETRFLEALAISDKIFGKTSDTSAARYTNLAMVSNLQGESSEAEERARSGLAIYEQQMATADRDGEPLDFPHETFGALNEQLACSFRDPSLANLARDHFEIAQEAYGSVSLSGKIQRVDRHLESLQAATDGETLPPCDFGFSKAR